MTNNKTLSAHKSENNQMKIIPFELLYQFFNEKAAIKTNIHFGFVKITNCYINNKMLKCFLNETLCIGCILKGEANIECNKTDYILRKGTGFLDMGGTVIEINHISDDFEMLFIYVSEQIKLKVISQIEKQPHSSLFHSHIIQMNDNQLDIFISTMNLLNKVHSYNPRNFQLSTSVCEFTIEIFKNLATDNHPIKEVPVQKDNNIKYQHLIYRQFLELLQTYSLKERSVNFYADKLCITQRSLGNIVKEFSGCSAKECIDKSVVIKAKILLAYSTMSIMQISEELNFTTLSAFTIYFKRLTNQTPLEYRKYACSESNMLLPPSNL